MSSDTPVNPEAIDSKPIEPSDSGTELVNTLSRDTADIAPVKVVRRHPTGPLMVWLLLQSAALAVAAFRIPLAARYPSTGERLAIDLLLAVQVAASALLFPWILRDLSNAVMSIASCWPMLALACLLSALTPATLFISCTYVTLWMASLAAWRYALKIEKSQAIGAATAGCWVIGGPILWYLRSEFNSRIESVPFPAPAFGPLTGALAQVEISGGRGADWCVIAALFTFGIATAGITRRFSHAGKPPAVAK